jgi:hypothetical protein
MADRPTAAELIEAVFEFLSAEVLPAASDDHRLKFRTLVAMNALAIARRELEAPSDGQLRADGRLARTIREQGADPALLPELKAHVAAKLRISNPAYLDKYGRP